MPEACPHCELEYDDFRTGETYQSIYMQFWRGSDDPSLWVNKRRHTVLGRWRQVKLSMWDEHLAMCQRQYEYELDQATTNLHGEFDRAPLLYGVTAQASAEFDDVPF